MNLLRQLPITLLAAVLFSNSAVAAEYFPPKRPPATNAVPPWRSITVHPPANGPKITLGKKLNPIWWLKNADQPVAPDDYLPNRKFRNLQWFFRNSFHNFTFYVIGVADKTFVRSGRYPDRVFKPGGGWNVAVVRYGILQLPFVSLRCGRLNVYVGWRDRGNFGAKLNLSSPKDKPPRPKKRASSPAP